MLNLTKQIYKNIKNHAISEKPNECCGLLIDINYINHIIRCTNISDDKQNNYTISPKDYLQASTMGKIIAFYHSHCLPEQPNSFTLLDKLNSIEHKLPLILYYLPEDEFKVFNENNLSNNYIGYKFEYNKTDCLALVEKFYFNEFGIILPHEFRDENWIDKNPHQIAQNISNFGFTETDNLKYGNVILIKNTKYDAPTHLMIYIGNNQVLHHKFNGYSTVEQYNNIYKKQTIKILKHKSLC